MKSRNIEYVSGDTNCIGHLAWDESKDGQRPGVVVFPEAFGLNDHARQRADALAQLGYVALAADLHGDGRLYDDLPSVIPAIRSLSADKSEWRSRAQAALNALISQPMVDANRTAAIGFCFGGVTCFELARSGAQLAAIATFHAGVMPGSPDDAGRIRAKVLICHGAEDAVVKKEALDAVIAELRRDQVDWQLLQYGNAVHSFTDPGADRRGMPGFAYNRAADERSWEAMRHLFREAFGQPSKFSGS